MMVDNSLPEKLVELQEFSEMVKFGFESNSSVLQKLMFWVISNMATGESTAVLDYFNMKQDIFTSIMTEFIDHPDIQVQREAGYVLYYGVAKLTDSVIDLFNNEFGVKKIAMTLVDYGRMLPETVYALLSLLDVFFEKSNDLICKFGNYNLADILSNVAEQFRGNFEIVSLSQKLSQILEKYEEYEMTNFTHTDF